MPLPIHWTDPALDDLESIFQFIAHDAPAYAHQFVLAIMHAIDRLEDFPLSGRKVPEANNDNVREVIFQGYRILYWIINNLRIDVIAVMHGSRDLGNRDNQPWADDATE